VVCQTDPSHLSSSQKKVFQYPSRHVVLLPTGAGAQREEEAPGGCAGLSFAMTLLMEVSCSGNHLGSGW